MTNLYKICDTRIFLAEVGPSCVMELGGCANVNITKFLARNKSKVEVDQRCSDYVVKMLE